MTRHATVATSAEVKAAIPALAALAGGIGDEAVRHRGTIGGSLANNDPAADYPAAVLALCGVRTVRVVPREAGVGSREGERPRMDLPTQASARKAARTV